MPGEVVTNQIAVAEGPMTASEILRTWTRRRPVFDHNWMANLVFGPAMRHLSIDPAGWVVAYSGLLRSQPPPVPVQLEFDFMHLDRPPRSHRVVRHPSPRRVGINSYPWAGQTRTP